MLITSINIIAGGYDKEDKAARSYDLAALKYWGTTTTTNFPVRTKYIYIKIYIIFTRAHTHTHIDFMFWLCQYLTLFNMFLDWKLRERNRGNEAHDETGIYSILKKVD